MSHVKCVSGCVGEGGGDFDNLVRIVCCCWCILRGAGSFGVMKKCGRVRGGPTGRRSLKAYAHLVVGAFVAVTECV